MNKNKQKWLMVVVTETFWYCDFAINKEREGTECFVFYQEQCNCQAPESEPESAGGSGLVAGASECRWPRERESGSNQQVWTLSQVTPARPLQLRSNKNINYTYFLSNSDKDIQGHSKSVQNFIFLIPSPSGSLSISSGSNEQWP